MGTATVKDGAKPPAMARMVMSERVCIGLVGFCAICNALQQKMNAVRARLNFSLRSKSLGLDKDIRKGREILDVPTVHVSAHDAYKYTAL
jgi:hypothetical protein